MCELVDDDEVVVAPIHAVERDAERLAGRPGKVGVAQDIVVEAVLGKDVGGQVGVVVSPVVGELLWAQHQDGSIAQLVILDDRQRGERFPETDAVSQNAAVVGLQLVDDAGRRVLLEVEQLVPDETVPIAGQIVWKRRPRSTSSRKSWKML